MSKSMGSNWILSALRASGEFDRLAAEAKELRRQEEHEELVWSLMAPIEQRIALRKRKEGTVRFEDDESPYLPPLWVPLRVRMKLRAMDMAREEFGGQMPAEGGSFQPRSQQGSNPKWKCSSCDQRTTTDLSLSL